MAEQKSTAVEHRGATRAGVWPGFALPRWPDVAQAQDGCGIALLRGEDVEPVSRNLGVTAPTLSQWRDVFPQRR